MTWYKYTKKESLQIHNNGLIVGGIMETLEKEYYSKKNNIKNVTKK